MSVSRICEPLYQMYVTAITVTRDQINVYTLFALLHTFNPDKYGVWNSRTEDTLKIIRRTPRPIFDAGKKYRAINDELTQLGAELDTDLTTIDGFMWFISKKVKILE